MSKVKEYGLFIDEVTSEFQLKTDEDIEDVIEVNWVEQYEKHTVEDCVKELVTLYEKNKG